MRTLDLLDLKERDVMLQRRFPVLTLEMTRTQLEAVLKEDPTPTLPLVENLSNMVFIGCIPRCTAEEFIHDAESAPNMQLRSALKLPQQEDDAMPTAIQPTAKDDDLPTDDIRKAESTSNVIEATTTPCVDNDNSPLDHLTSVAETINAAVRQRQSIDTTALQVDPDTSLQQVHLLFEMIKCSSIWVTRRGRLVGLLHRRNLHTHVAELKRRQNMVLVCPYLLARSGLHPPS